MNYWTELSIKYANQRSYLDDLFAVYPLAPEGIRGLDEGKWNRVKKAFAANQHVDLVSSLLDLDLFPIKDSYVAFFRKDKSSIHRNPKTVHRICGRLYELGLDQIYNRCSEPKETNRQIGPLFNRWLQKGSLGLPVLTFDEMSKSTHDGILLGSDSQLKLFAEQNLNYKGQKGLDLIVRISNQFVLGEAKFLTDFGGHQNAQFQDAMQLFTQPDLMAIPVAILDGVVYLKNKSKMYQQLSHSEAQHPVFSALLFREFLYSL